MAATLPFLFPACQAMPTEDHPLVIAAGSDLTRQIAFGENSLNLNGVNDCRRLLVEAGIGHGLFFITPNYFRQSVRMPPPAGKLLLNLISDADQNRQVLGVLERVLRDPSITALNHPARVKATTREQVARRLEGIPGLAVPKTWRIALRDGKPHWEALRHAAFRFPAILRPIGTHGGEGVRLVAGPDDLPSPGALREAYLTEFVDTRSDDGYYRKYRCFFIGRAIVFRHLIVSDHWSVHAGDRKRLMLRTEWMMREEEAIHAAGAAHFGAERMTTLERIRSAMGLDYFGLDFAVLASGELLLFEANATMNFFPFSTPDRGHYSWRCLPVAVEAIRALVTDRLAP